MKYLFQKGNIPWNKGRKNTHLKGRWILINCRECGKHFGHEKWNIYRKFCSRKCYGKYRSKNVEEFGNFIGKHHSLETKQKLTNLLKNYMKTKKYQRAIKIMLGRKGKTQLESIYEKIFNDLNLPYKYVGDGKFSIERKIPDFINTNGKKIAIEVYARAHKEKFRGGLKRWKINRTSLFKKYGWKVIYLDETMMKLDIVNKILGGGENYNH